MKAVLQKIVLLTFLIGCAHGFCQSFFYVEPGNTACPAISESTTPAQKAVQSGVAVSGSLSVGCGFDKGSYTVALSSSDPKATFSPKTFLVNFGRLNGDGTFTVTFVSIGVHTVSATITSNMGSPTVPGRFVSHTSEFNVAPP